MTEQVEVDRSRVFFVQLMGIREVDEKMRLVSFSDFD
jgi:hypothetical protein